MNPDRPSTSTASGHDPFTVGHLLRDPALRGARVLAGAGELTRQVTWCLPWGEAVADAEAIDGVVVFARVADVAAAAATGRLDQLTARGAAALLLSGDSGCLSPAAMASVGLPVVQLPAAVGFLLTSRIVAERALAETVQVLEYGITVHRTLADLLHRGAGLPALGRQLAALSRSPAFILDAQGAVLAYEYVGAASVPDPFEVVRLLGEHDVIGRPDGERRGPRVEVMELALEDERVICVVGPIVLAHKHLGSLVIVELDPQPAAHDLAQHRVIVEQASTIAGTELLRLRSIEEAMERARGDFVHALLHGRFANQHDLIARAAHHAFDISARYGVVAARGLNGGDAGQSMPAMLTAARRAEQLLRRERGQTLATVIDNLVVVIRQIQAVPGGRQDGSSANAQIAEFAEAFASALKSQFAGQVTVTYGRLAANARGIPTSYREARIALGVCERLGGARVAGYSELRVFAALADVARSPQGRSFATEVLAPLRRDGSGGDLERTAVAYLESGGNLNAAARRLRLHRNTMLYKLDRASRLLGLDLREADDRFTLWLAHRIDLLGDVQAGVDGDLSAGP